MAAEGRGAYFGNLQRESRPQERIYRNAHLRNKRGGSQGGSEKSQSLSPVSVISVHSSKYSSVSPPKLGDALSKKDMYEKSPSNHRSSIPHSNSSDNVRTRNIHLSRNYAQSRGISPPKRSRSRSRSLPKRYRQRSRSPYKQPARRRRSRSRSGRHQRSRSQSRGRSDRHRRSRSRGRHIRSHRSRSPGRPMKSRRSRSRSVSPRSSGRHWSKSRSRSREPARRRHRSRSVSPRTKSGSNKRLDEKALWEAFRVQMRDLEENWEEERKEYEKNPESHPDYKMEWKTFYKRRVQELLERGDDPKLHNFESDWAYFWKFRMDELLNLEYVRRKVAVKRKLNLPDDAEMPVHLQAREKVEMSSNRLPSISGGGCPGLISTLRIVTAVEEQLGSLGPRVNVLLSKAVTLQRISGSNPDSLLAEQENVILLETVKEKLLGQLQTKIVKKSLEAPVEEAVISITALVDSVASSYPITVMGSLHSLGGDVNTMPQNSVTSDVVNVGGVGQVDRVAIAQQIADALIMQGKTDVTEAELQELVNNVVGMLEAQSAAERMNQPKVASGRPQIMEPINVTPVEDTPKVFVQDSQVVSSSVLSNPAKVSESVMLLNTVEETKSAKPQLQENEAFNILMSVVKSGIKNSDSFEKSQSWSSDDSDEPSNSKHVQNKSNPAKTSVHDSEKVSSEAESSLTVNPEPNKAAEMTNSNEANEEGSGSSVFGKKTPQKWYKRVNRSPSPEIFKALKQKSMMAGLQEMAKSKSSVRRWNKDLSPFSSREETSNPLAASEEEEDEDLKVIGAWDSDSDIDLDSCEKTKVPAYDKVNVKKPSPAKYEKNTSQLNKIKSSSTSISSPVSVSSDLNLDATIDNLMGKLNNKTSKIEVISGKQSDSANPIRSIVSASQSNSQGQYFPIQSQLSVSNQGYGMPYNYPQQQMYSGQPGYYNSGSVPNYGQYSGQSYGNYPAGRTASQSYPGVGTVMYSTNNAQWQNYYGQQ